MNYLDSVLNLHFLDIESILTAYAPHKLSLITKGVKNYQEGLKKIWKNDISQAIKPVIIQKREIKQKLENRSKNNFIDSLQKKIWIYSPEASSKNYSKNSKTFKKIQTCKNKRGSSLTHQNSFQKKGSEYNLNKTQRGLLEAYIEKKNTSKIKSKILKSIDILDIPQELIKPCVVSKLKQCNSDEEVNLGCEKSDESSISNRKQDIEKLINLNKRKIVVKKQGIQFKHLPDLKHHEDKNHHSSIFQKKFQRNNKFKNEVTKNILFKSKRRTVSKFDKLPQQTQFNAIMAFDASKEIENIENKNLNLSYTQEFEDILIKASSSILKSNLISQSSFSTKNALKKMKKTLRGRISWRFKDRNPPKHVSFELPSL